MDNVFTSFNRLEVPSLREKVVISRYWNKPEITVTVNADKIVILGALDAFIEALAAEMTRPAFILTRKQMAQQLRAASVLAVAKIKESTAQVM